MRIGLLECDHVAERYLPIAGDYSHMFTAMVADADPDAEVVVYDVHGGVLPTAPTPATRGSAPDRARRCTTTSRGSSALADFVRDVHDAHVPFVGVCFGHQLIAHALGGRTERARSGGAPAPCDGDHRPGRRGCPRPCRPSRSCTATRTRSRELPPGGRVLAAAPHCPVAMLAVGDDVIGVQAHPEFGAAVHPGPARGPGRPHRRGGHRRRPRLPRPAHRRADRGAVDPSFLRARSRGQGRPGR